MNSSNYKAKILEELKADKEAPDADLEEILSLSSDDEKVMELINRLSGNECSAREKQGALSDLQLISNFSSVLTSRTVEYTNAMRGLLDHDDRGLQQQAYRSLAVMKDEVVQNRLLEELNSDKAEDEKTIPTYQAIALLGFDDKVLDCALLSKVVQNPPDDDSLVEAVRHMPADEEALPILIEIMNDVSKPMVARSLVPDIVNNINPATLLAETSKILQEETTDYEIVPYLARSVAEIEYDDIKIEVEEAKQVFREYVDKNPDLQDNASLTTLFSKE